MAVARAYDEIVDFIAHGSDPGAVSTFRPSPQAKERVAELVAKEKSAILTAEERSELDHYVELEHTMRLAKARAKQILAAL